MKVESASIIEPVPEEAAPALRDEHGTLVPRPDHVKLEFEVRGKSIARGYQMWNAHFPPPQAVRAYEEIMPGSWERLLKMAEDAQAADISNVRINQEQQRSDTRRGQLLGVLVILVAMASALYCAKLNQPWVAAAFLSMTVMAVARSLIESIRGHAVPPTGERTTVRDKKS